ncbi:response regulator [Poseidonocella sp. HB161398]|uniref:response regulator n=1 Tax=Poseidonocella sp. HB161398 TaxID=2320855 RepID=UPI0014874842|nr:response regulator [Poseidonocella sp. HB161398]
MHPAPSDLKIDLKTLPVLCLDDEVLVAIDMAEILAERGFSDVSTAFTLRSAGELLDRKPIRLAILDVNLGHGETSFEIARRIEEAGGTVVFASGYGMSQLPEEFHGNTILSKPIHENALTAALDRLG